MLTSVPDGKYQLLTSDLYGFHYYYEINIVLFLKLCKLIFFCMFKFIFRLLQLIEEFYIYKINVSSLRVLKFPSEMMLAIQKVHCEHLNQRKTLV